MKTKYLKEATIKAEFGGGTWTAPTTYYFGFLKQLPTYYDPPDKLPDEVTGEGYTRVAVPNDEAHWETKATGSSYSVQFQSRNVQTIQWPAPLGNGWGAFSGVGIYDAPTGGNLLYYSGNGYGYAYPLVAGIIPLIAPGTFVISSS